ncbi:tetratricopeptide repeat protein [Croceitalea vernalis]|uniref:Tetratricopeptide repeat protein n=1 Tax=Croceitalea vernalis TaxID=3075599 RepID=A0ABU3BEH2_9FLAO|nr:hypothetical protein [Croceitalea sp. P007]MDT0620548.1 hypothetical protein [Croceitalea sp. P007]
MKDLFFFLVIMVAVLGSQFSYAQEEKIIETEESAEVFLEEYTDEFQEAFFEATKQKGIQNYDRAVNLFLECKQLDSENEAIDHELAKTYLLDKQFFNAEKYAVEAIIADPTNYWYLDTLVEIIEKQSNTIESVQTTIPFKNHELQKNLSLVYYKREKFNDALIVVNQLPVSAFKEQLINKIEDALSRKSSVLNVKKPGSVIVNNDPVKSLELNLEQQISLEQFTMVESKAKEAVELYPLQPFFYFAYGLALHKNNKDSQAIDVLQSSLDYLFDNQKLANRVYQTLSDAYTKTNNFSKANEYLRKIKPGF